jgi:hypothetical protein
MVLPGAGVSANVLATVVRGNSAGPSKFPELTGVASRVNCWTVVCPDASVTRVLKVNAPALVALPAITPVLEFKPKPLGSAPEYKEKLYGAAPPSTVIDALYGAFTSALLNDDVAIVSGFKLCTVMLAEVCTTLFAAAVAVTTAVPALLGAVNTPFEEMDPVLADQTTAVCGVFLTVAVNCTLAPGAS